MPGVIYDLQGHLLLRRMVTTPVRGDNLSTRGAIRGFSPRAGARMRRYLRTCVAEYTVLLTLTYPFDYPTTGVTAKRHLDAFIKCAVRQHSKDAASVKKFSAFWFLEFQARGAPHFHVFLTCRLEKDWVSDTWYRVVGSEDRRHLAAGARIESLRSGRYGTCAYASKYAAKAEQKEIPPNFVNVGRFWGVYGQRECLAATVFFPLEMLDSPIFLLFRAELRLLLQQRHQVVRKMKLHGFSSGLILQTMGLQREVNLLFHRTAQKMIAQGDMTEFFESPLLDCPPEVL